MNLITEELFVKAVTRVVPFFVKCQSSMKMIPYTLRMTDDACRPKLVRLSMAHSILNRVSVVFAMEYVFIAPMAVPYRSCTFYVHIDTVLKMSTLFAQIWPTF